MSRSTDATARLQYSREHWLRTLDRDARSQPARMPGMLGGLLQGLGSTPWQPWLSGASALWLAWRRHRAAPPPRATGRRRAARPLLIGALLITALAALWWRSRTGTEPR